MAEFSVVDASWELIDPNPDIHQLFSQFNDMFFGSKLGGVYVQWSHRMTLCAGTCKFHPRNRECSIQLSKPLLSYRPRKDLVETLLHEMIHAFLFMADGNRERESHGPKFHEHMYRINKMTGANITVYHSFHDEVNHFKTHWWKCNGPCQHRHPYYGIVKRSMNRAPGPNDLWYSDHQKSCGGTFTKIKEPPPKKQGDKRKRETQKSPEGKEGNENKNKITNYFVPPVNGATPTATATSSQPSSSTSAIPAPSPAPEPFAGRGFVLGSIGNSASSSNRSASSSASSSGTNLGGNRPQQPPRRGDHPLLSKWLQNYKTPNQTSSGSGNTFNFKRPTAIPSTSSSSSSTGSNLSSSKNKPPNGIEVIDLD